jgi:hypothetical protein
MVETENESVENKQLFTVRRLAIYFDCTTEDGKPAVHTIFKWIRQGKLPPPDFRISQSAMYWRPETIDRWMTTYKRYVRS